MTNARAAELRRRRKRAIVENQNQDQKTGDQIETRLTLEPKVFLPHVTQPGQTPRRVAVERQKQLFAAQDISALLVEHGVTEEMLRDEECALPASLFDDTKFEMLLPREWIRRGDGPYEVCELVV